MMVHSLRYWRVALIVTLAHSLALGSATSGLNEIQQLAGCFEVSYRFVEDGIHDIFSERYGLTNPAKEWVGVKRTGDAYLLQHVLVVGSRPIPHWHE
ncbi:MAG: hypothetical protein HYS38_07170, partial [Acidobacteria bacterium]|nr:hypothetical protein [Acidobacteriota bacterium]